jgi:hypothetical protein
MTGGTIGMSRSIATPASAPVAGDVLGVLAPLATAYVRRASPGSVRAGPAPKVASADALEPTFRPCSVEGVVTIDAERRVLWPDALRGDGRRLVALRAAGGAIDVTVNAPPGTSARAVDQRGRLRLPGGVLRAAGLGPGDRVVIVRAGARDQVLLVRADRVGIDVTAR